MTTIGNLRHSVTIEQGSEVSDGQGGSSTTWTPYITAYAEIKPKTGMIRLEAQKVETDVSHSVTIRYRKGVALTTDMRVNYTVGAVTRYFFIQAILNEDERNRFYVLLCKEGVAR